MTLTRICIFQSRKPSCQEAELKRRRELKERELSAKRKRADQDKKREQQERDRRNQEKNKDAMTLKRGVNAKAISAEQRVNFDLGELNLSSISS